MFKKNIINNLIITLLLALAIGFFVSRALVSIATVILFLLAVAYWLKIKKQLFYGSNKNSSIIFFCFYLLIMLCSAFTGRLDCTIQPLISFAPLLLLPFAFMVFDDKIDTLKSAVNIINWVFIGGTLFLLLNMVYRQGFDTTKIIKLAHDSKNVSNILEIHHNIVGFLAVYSIFYIAETLKQNKNLILFFLLLLIIILIHYLGLRFAIMAFYPLMLVYLLRFRIKASVKLYTLTVGFLLLAGSFIFIPAFNARYHNTKADLQNIITHHNPNYYSLNQRLIANQIGIAIAKNNWFFGVGTCQIKEYMEQEYTKNSRLLIPENRKFIHNEIIYGWATFGILYVLGWLLLFGFLIYNGLKAKSILLEITLLFILHQMVENTLEKQLMLMLLIYFTLIMPKGLESGK